LLARRWLIKMLLFDKLFQNLDGFFGISTLSLDFQSGPATCSEHADLHDALAINVILIIADGDIAVKLIRNIYKLHSGTHMKAVRVSYLDRRFANYLLQGAFSGRRYQTRINTDLHGFILKSKAITSRVRAAKPARV